MVKLFILLIQLKTFKKKRKCRKNSESIFEKKGGANMSWEEILKGYQAISLPDKRLINYILRDGEFRTLDAILDEIYDLLEENAKMGNMKVSSLKGRPQATRFGAARKNLKDFFTKSPDYESRDTGNKTAFGSPIKEYRYIGE